MFQCTPVSYDNICSPVNARHRPTNDTHHELLSNGHLFFPMLLLPCFYILGSRQVSSFSSSFSISPLRLYSCYYLVAFSSRCNIELESKLRLPVDTSSDVELRRWILEFFRLSLNFTLYANSCFRRFELESRLKICFTYFFTLCVFRAIWHFEVA